MKVRPAAWIVQDGLVLTMRYQYGTEIVHVLPGGNPDPGESLPETLARELEEELGVTARIGRMILACEVLNFNQKEDTLHCVFEAEIASGEPHLDHGHTSAQAIAWISPDELAQLTLYPNVSEFLGETTGSFRYAGPVVQPYKS